VLPSTKLTSNLNLGKLLLAGYARHCTHSTFNNQHGSHKKPPHPLLPRIRVAAITNDTVATFVSLAYAVHSKPNSRVAMGLIVGTGTNATVPMPPNRLHASKKAHLSDSAAHTVVINTEWTIRGTDAPLVAMDIKTRWDATLDAASDAPGFQPFEYMTAGRYLGEIVRLVYVGVEGEDVPASLHVKNALPTRFLSEVVARLDLQRITEELEERYPGERGSPAYWTNERVALLKRVAEAVQRRSSALIAAACVGLLHCVGDICIDDVVGGREALSNGANVEELVIAYAGGTISQYPQWLETCQAWIDKLVTAGLGANAAKRVVLREALDGGIIGAAVLASMTGDIA
jgi:hexokinase